MTPKLAYNKMTREQKFEHLRQRYQIIFERFTAQDFEHPVTSKTILAALDSIRLELYKLTRK